MQSSSLFLQNRLLRTAVRARKWRPLVGMKHVVFEAGHQFWSPESPLPYALFPLRGVVSMQIPSSPARQIEVGMVGYEGFAGVPLFFSAKQDPMTAVALTAGEAMAATPAVFRDCLRIAAFRTAVESYINFFITMLAEISFCTRVHAIDKHIIGRLLLIQERTNTGSLHLTQDAFSRLLGVRRATISQAVAQLREQDIIEYDHRGRLTILDQTRLERLRCPCFQAIRAEFDHLPRAGSTPQKEKLRSGK